MRRRLFVLVCVVVLLVVACGGAAAPDPYDLIKSSTETTWSPVQINMGVSFTSGGKTVALDPADLAFVVDSVAGKAAVHISLPASSLGIPATAMAELGVESESLDFDLVYDGQALYARSALLKPMLKFVLTPSGKLPKGDLSGWLKLGSKDELTALAALAGGNAPTPSIPPGASDTAAVKSALEAAGISLSVTGTEKHNGVDAQHIKIAIDSAKLAADPNFASGAGAQYRQVAAALKTVSMTGDLWIDSAAKRIVESDLHAVSVAIASETADFTVTMHDPDGSVPLDAPSTFVDVPINTLFAEIMKLVTKQMES